MICVQGQLTFPIMWILTRATILVATGPHGPYVLCYMVTIYHSDSTSYQPIQDQICQLIPGLENTTLHTSVNIHL